jgi:hypothetical protein
MFRRSLRIIGRDVAQVNGFKNFFSTRARKRGVHTALSCALFLLAFDLHAAGTPWHTAVFPSGAAFALEVAADPVARSRGYMHRAHVGTGEGMLFVFEEAGAHGFWMKNCRVALDIIWLDDELRVVEIAENLAPCPPTGRCPQIAPMRAARYVLEVAAGTSQREGLRLGDSVVLLAGTPSP